MFTPSDHTFVICAYKESPYLEECIVSLKAQSIKTNIILSTSTLNDFIRILAEQYEIPVFVNHGETGIAGDWNFALSCSKTSLVTIAHQDDIYEPEYVLEMLRAMNRAKSPILYSCGYGELRNGKKVTRNKLLRIKKMLLIPIRLLPDSITARRFSLAFGDSICCPSVTYVRDVILSYPFRTGYKAALDWQQWEIMSALKGTFSYCSKVLMYHRIHEASETTHIIGENHLRQKENYEMFCKFWPPFAANILNRIYSHSEKSNTT